MQHTEPAPITLKRLDHLVLTVADVEKDRRLLHQSPGHERRRFPRHAPCSGFWRAKNQSPRKRPRMGTEGRKAYARLG